MNYRNEYKAPKLSELPPSYPLHLPRVRWKMAVNVDNACDPAMRWQSVGAEDNCVSSSGIFQFLPSCPPQLEQWSSNSLLTLIIIKHVPGLRPGRGQPYTGQGDSSQLRRLVRGWCSPIVPVCRERWRLHFSVGVYLEWLGKSVDNVISQGWRRCDVCWSDINIWQQMAAIHHRSPYSSSWTLWTLPPTNIQSATSQASLGIKEE